MNNSFDALLMAYFESELLTDGEQIRLAVTAGPEPTTWVPLDDGRPMLRSTVGERGARDPFLIRDTRRGVFNIIATDLRVFPDQDWDRATRAGSRSIVVWESEDLVTWSEPWLCEVSPPTAANTWAPKAFWSASEQHWVVLWASALYDNDDRTSATYQRILMATTADFREFTAPVVYLDLGFNVIDVTFLENEGTWYRFSATAHGEYSPDLGNHIFIEQGPSMLSADFRPLAVDVGKGVLVRGEGPAVVRSVNGDRWYLLIDEFGHRGYQLFETTDLATGKWDHLSTAVLPAGARHGSLLPITLMEKARLIEANRREAIASSTGSPRGGR
ncbi:glycoside hydrolase family 43 protein [Leifsonia aquatica]|uniref:glycoside hydrolase family 43 protein n=1 Tax=Leifsonia aquatica TaxID=144185 RepID=UPI00046A3512|nr:glycoside hydrolase family 43 protein [Leifsonia aquatica]